MTRRSDDRSPTPVYRAALLIQLLRERPRTLPELQAELGRSGAQVRRDLRDLAAAGWQIQQQGRPAHVWIEPEEFYGSHR